MLVRNLITALALYGSVLVTTGQASTVWNESVDGDAGASFAAAVNLGTLSGGNIYDIFGTVGGSDSVDYFKFTAETAFIINAPVVTIQPGNPSTGFPLYNSDQSINTNLGLTGPGTNIFGTVLAGTYYLRPAELFSEPTTYKFTIITELAAVPVPAALPLLAAGLGGLLFIARRKRRSA